MTKRIQPCRKMAVDILILSTPYATVAQATLIGTLEGKVFTVTGESKKEPGDVYDPVIDVDLAVGRALVRLGEQMVRSGNARVQAATLGRAKKNVTAKLEERRPHGRHVAKHAGLLSLADVEKEYGRAAAVRAADRRGVLLYQMPPMPGHERSGASG